MITTTTTLAARTDRREYVTIADSAGPGVTFPRAAYELLGAGDRQEILARVKRRDFVGLDALFRRASDARPEFRAALEVSRG